MTKDGRTNGEKGGYLKESKDKNRTEQNAHIVVLRQTKTKKEEKSRFYMMKHRYL